MRGTTSFAPHETLLSTEINLLKLHGQVSAIGNFSHANTSLPWHFIRADHVGAFGAFGAFGSNVIVGISASESVRL